MQTAGLELALSVLHTSSLCNESRLTRTAAYISMSQWPPPPLPMFPSFSAPLANPTFEHAGEGGLPGVQAVGLLSHQQVVHLDVWAADLVRDGHLIGAEQLQQQER